jgi:hypothetical protein
MMVQSMVKAGISGELLRNIARSLSGLATQLDRLAVDLDQERRGLKQAQKAPSSRRGGLHMKQFVNELQRTASLSPTTDRC